MRIDSHDGLHDIKRRSPDVAEHYADRHKESGEGDPAMYRLPRGTLIHNLQF